MEPATIQTAQGALALSNPSKLLYPSEGFSKRDVVTYLADVSTPFLRHAGGRPVALVRFPNGIDEKRFFTKNRPKGSPDWVHHVLITGGKPVDFIVPTDDRTLLWLGSLAALEIHVMNIREPALDCPDYLAFDLDPSEESPFVQTVDLALRLREHLQNHGYTPFAKTSGKKGIHVVAPIVPRRSIDDCFAAAKELARSFVKMNPDATLQLNKEKRRGRVLIDVYRNARGQLIVAPYSLRAAPGAPVSMPLPWDELAALDDPAAFNIRTAREHLQERGDAWEDFAACAAPLHTTGVDD